MLMSCLVVVESMFGTQPSNKSFFVSLCVEWNGVYVTLANTTATIMPPGRLHAHRSRSNVVE